jgi:hypothetical protein
LLASDTWKWKARPVGTRSSSWGFQVPSCYASGVISSSYQWNVMMLRWRLKPGLHVWEPRGCSNNPGLKFMISQLIRGLSERWLRLVGLLEKSWRLMEQQDFDMTMLGWELLAWI